MIFLSTLFPLNHLLDVKLADPGYALAGKVDILLGVEVLLGCGSVC